MTAPTDNRVHSLRYLAAEALQFSPDPAHVPAEIVQFCQNVAYVQQNMQDDIDECSGLTTEIVECYTIAEALPDEVTTDELDALAETLGYLTQRVHPVWIRVAQMADWLSGQLDDSNLAAAHEIYTEMSQNMQSSDQWLSAMSDSVREARQN